MTDSQKLKEEIKRAVLDLSVADREELLKMIKGGPRNDKLIQSS